MSRLLQPYDVTVGTRRGLYAKGEAKKAEILTVALDTIARNGYSGATVKELAEAVGISQNGLLHYFGSKDALFTEIIRRRDQRDRELLGATQPAASAGEFIAGVLRLIRHNSQVPGFIQLYSRLSNEAAEPGHPAHDYFRDHYQTTISATTAAFSSLQDEGRLAARFAPRRLAVMLWALVDGLQTQWLFDSDLDMAKHVDFFLTMLGLHDDEAPGKPPTDR